jgi:S-adenosylmethionine:tRNA ribosyltransferase-isomerase
MHAEEVFIPQSVTEAVASCEGKIVAVGTTSLRALESAAVGCRSIRSGSFSTELFVTPGYQFNVVDALVTNFHMPRSTLMVLVSSFAGRDHIMRAYTEAVERHYRFLSFGDAMYIAGHKR